MACVAPALAPAGARCGAFTRNGGNTNGKGVVRCGLRVRAGAASPAAAANRGSLALKQVRTSSRRPANPRNRHRSDLPSTQPPPTQRIYSCAANGKGILALADLLLLAVGCHLTREARVQLACHWRGGRCVIRQPSRPWAGPGRRVDDNQYRERSR